MQENTFTQGNIVRGMLRFSVPYLITCFLQTFYGMADLFIVGQFNEAASITAVSVGSQLMHMLTVVIAGFAMGSTVLIARSVGDCGIMFRTECILAMRKTWKTKSLRNISNCSDTNPSERTRRTFATVFRARRG